MNSFIFTKHAKVRMLQRKITEKEINSTIDNPDIIKDSFKERIVVKKKFSKGNLEVFYKQSINETIIITCYWTKGD